MPVIQTNVWACEICRFTAFTVEDVSPFSDPVVTSPPGGEWEYVSTTKGFGFFERLACPACVAKNAVDMAGEKE